MASPKFIRTRLTEREVQVLRLFAQGTCVREVATALNLSVKTVDCYRYKIQDKLNLPSATCWSLMRAGIQCGLCTVAPVTGLEGTHELADREVAERLNSHIVLRLNRTALL